MLLRALVRVAVSAIAIMCFMHAARAAPCKTNMGERSPELILDLGDKATQEGLLASFKLGLLPAEFPSADIAKIKSPCSRGTFAVGAKTAEIFGEHDTLPQLWAQFPGKSDVVVYFASMPQPEAASIWHQAFLQQSKTGAKVNAKFKSGEMMIAIAVYRKGSPVREIYGFLMELPDDSLARAWAAQVLSGARKPVGFYNVGTRSFALPK